MGKTQEESAETLEAFVQSEDNNWEVLKEFNNIPKTSELYTQLYYKARQKIRKYAESVKQELLGPVSILESMNPNSKEWNESDMKLAKQILDDTEGLRNNMNQCVAAVQDVFKVDFNVYLNTAPEKHYKD